MAGIYIHIPFCKQACNYCNFYFSTSLANKAAFLAALHHEVELTKDYLENEKIETIYLGGGTPSLLQTEEIKSIVEKLNSIYDLSGLKEFTLEANPDDLDAESVKALAALKSVGLNRFSIGIQSFFDEDLTYMNRAHNSEEALASIKRVQDTGFDKITIDLIYGTPTMNDERWMKNLETAFGLNVPHISSYALTVEPKTALESKIKKGNAKPVDEEQSARQFKILMKEMSMAGFEQYEISNFAKDKKYAVHNTNYWLGKKYLGLGPSAHSFDGSSRRWNVANNIQYINVLKKSELAFEEEQLSESQRINEQIMTQLRTMWGLNLEGFSFLTESRKKEVRANLDKELGNIDSTFYSLDGSVVHLTSEGKFFADKIAAWLFVE